MAHYEYKIGATSGTLAYLESIADAMCQGEFVRWPKVYTGADGQRHGDGLPVARWRFAWISQADLNTLRGYVTTGGYYVPSKVCAIKTRMDDGTFDEFDCIMHWPDNLEAKREMGGHYRDVVIEFTHLEVVS